MMISKILRSSLKSKRVKSQSLMGKKRRRRKKKKKNSRNSRNLRILKV